MKDWVLDHKDGSLTSGTEGVSLSPKAASVLKVLVEQAGGVLSKEDILDQVWEGLHVSPDLVREYIFEIRQALGDKASDPHYIETVGRRGFRLIGPISLRSAQSVPKRPAQLPVVKYCPSKDGTSIAHASSGNGKPLLFAGSWMTHLDMDWESPAYGDYIRHLSDRFQVIRYDQRGNGLSQWDNLDISFEGMVDDMEVVVDTYGFDQVAILGMSQGASVAIAYALRHPERISHLVLNGGYARGRRQRGDPAAHEESEALVSLIRNSWGNENPLVRQAFTTMFMPDASQEEMQWFNEFQRLCGPGENIAKFRELFDDMNVTDLLPKVQIPTLVLHSDRDSVAPISEGKLIASRIPDASFVQLNSPNHMLFESETDFAKMIESIDEFLKQTPAATLIAKAAPATDAERPVLAVIPFTNLSNDPDQDFFSQGISEDIVTALAGSIMMSVTLVSDVTNISSPKVHYVLQGSVRRSGDRLRVTARLNEAAGNRQVWANNYDRNIADIFDIQDEVARSIASIIPGRVHDAIAETAARKPTNNLRAYECLLRAKSLRDGFSADATLKARKLFQQAIELDPSYARAWGYLSDTYFVDVMLGLAQPGDAEKCYDLIVKALNLDPTDVSSQDGLGFAYIALGQWENAITQFRKTVAAVNTQAEPSLWCGYGLAMSGELDEGQALVEKAILHDPLHPPSFEWVLGQILVLQHDFQKAREALSAGALLNSVAHACRVTCLVHLGEKDEAKTALAEFLKVRREEMASRQISLTDENIESLVGGYRDILRREEDWKLIADALIETGLKP